MSFGKVYINDKPIGYGALDIEVKDEKGEQFMAFDFGKERSGTFKVDTASSDTWRILAALCKRDKRKQRQRWEATRRERGQRLARLMLTKKFINQEMIDSIKKLGGGYGKFGIAAEDAAKSMEKFNQTITQYHTTRSNEQ